MENNVNKRIDNLQYSISKLASQQHAHQEGENPEEECQSDIMVEEQCQQQQHQGLIEDFIELSEG